MASFFDCDLMVLDLAEWQALLESRLQIFQAYLLLLSLSSLPHIVTCVQIPTIDSRLISNFLTWQMIYFVDHNFLGTRSDQVK
jgi:hypothetical protein